ncbi:amylo-alpha-1,6-glucosidase [Anaerosacchariphilus polymeriproducens]|uniref:Glycogen debranching protein n=1 Tax=Anaerosacchariphilus polymeriproducens TaxID=1812858 RepID=A0A371AS34_9FIRM|nr:amylo-alpha-1,6-glucosidase [Anaerosacchariphilus polymeriproducens]RDU22388.1 glycogen debranching protein [Anaerosacchariphilus polymeriproducens]
MKIQLGKNEWKTFEKGQEKCYLLTNGLGGFSSLTMIGSNARNDHALMMTSVKAPNLRFHMITNVQEKLQIGEKIYDLSNQEYVNRTKNQYGFTYLQSASYEYFPQWTYQIEGIEIVKTIVMVHGENTVGVSYKIYSHNSQKAKLILTPLLRFTLKDQMLQKEQLFELNHNYIKSNGQMLYFQTNGLLERREPCYMKDLYFEYDARDGREAVGTAFVNHNIVIEIQEAEKEAFLIYSNQLEERKIQEILHKERSRMELLEAQCSIQNPAGRMLARNADQYIVYRESTRGKSIIAGYPFFGDWGRDTMIAMIGCTIVTKQFEAAKSILRTFQSYCRNGIMPNVFPEEGTQPFYNTVDASLLFIETVYQYYLATQDNVFVSEMYPVMKEIIQCYCNGTENHIHMDADGLIKAGADLEQLTWMDVRVGDVLPTPRHGKPVEVNAYWYNALMVMSQFSKELDDSKDYYEDLAGKVKESFIQVFWDDELGCLKDVISGTLADKQIRCNQIWALSMSFSMLDQEKSEKILGKVYEKLYTPYGLRSLAFDDNEFHAFCKGSAWDRDMAYHQGTVWAFPLGAYFRAYLRWSKDKVKAIQTVERQLQDLEPCLTEGCLGHIAEIYDGINPNESRGCFAQAWSVGEIVRVYELLERFQKEEQR